LFENVGVVSRPTRTAEKDTVFRGTGVRITTPTPSLRLYPVIGPEAVSGRFLKSKKGVDNASIERSARGVVHWPAKSQTLASEHETEHTMEHEMGSKQETHGLFSRLVTFPSFEFPSRTLVGQLGCAKFTVSA